MNPNYPNYPNRNPPPNFVPGSNPFTNITGEQPKTFADLNKKGTVNIDPKFAEINRQKVKNGMYSSTMEFNKPTKGLSSLESMGRFVGGASDKIES